MREGSQILSYYSNGQPNINYQQKKNYYKIELKSEESTRIYCRKSNIIRKQRSYCAIHHKKITFCAVWVKISKTPHDEICS